MQTIFVDNNNLYKKKVSVCDTLIEILISFFTLKILNDLHHWYDRKG